MIERRHDQTEILRQLSALTHAVQEGNEARDKMHKENREALQGINEFINGNGKRGAKARLDMLEYKTDGTLWGMGAVLLAALGVWVKRWWGGD